MEASQQLSATAAAAKLRATQQWQRAGDTASKTVMAAWVPERIATADGDDMCWSDAMESLKVHPGVEVVVIPSGSDAPRALWGAQGLRVKPGGTMLRAGTLLGEYQGWVGTLAEATSLAHQHAHRLFAGGGCCCSHSAAREEARLKLAVERSGYVASLRDSTRCGDVGLVVSPFGRAGEWLGNEMARINDGAADPVGPLLFAQKNDHGGECAVVGASSGNEEGSVPASTKDHKVESRAANVRFAAVRYKGWPHLVVVTTADIAPGEDVLISYEEEYWVTQRAGLMILDIFQHMQRAGGCCAALLCWWLAHIWWIRGTLLWFRTRRELRADANAAAHHEELPQEFAWI